MVESFVEGPTFHVDGLVTDGVLLFSSVSRYFNSSLSYQTGTSSGCTLLDPADQPSGRLVAEAKKVIAALPTAPHLAFHAEFFLDTSDRIVFGEIAARPGGSRIAETIEYAYGLNIYEQWVRRSFGLPIELPESRPWRTAGRLFVPPRRARLRSVPTATPFPWVLDYRQNAKVDDVLEEPSSSASHFASFVVMGRDTTQVESRLQELDSWFRAQIVWDDCRQSIGDDLRTKYGRA
jgi:hypothetical protein